MPLCEQKIQSNQILNLIFFFFNYKQKITQNKPMFSYN